MNYTKAKDQLIVQSVLQAVNSRPMTEKQRLFLAKHLEPAHLERIKTIAEASVQVRLVLADKKSPEEDDHIVREPTEPSERQIELATKIGVDAQFILTASSAELSEAIDERLALLGKRRDEARAMNASDKQVALLVKRGVDEAMARSLTRGQASDAINKIMASYRR